MAVSRNPAVRESPSWRTWLPEVDARVFGGGVRLRSAIGQQVAEIQRITGLSDSQLAAAFPAGLSRETVNRWRNRPNPNLREENIYRLGLLHELAQRMEEAGIDAHVWLDQAGEEGETPYALICQGRLGDVRRAVELVAAGAVSPAERMAVVRAYREHDAVVEEDDDEGEWTWGEADGAEYGVGFFGGTNVAEAPTGVFAEQHCSEEGVYQDGEGEEGVLMVRTVLFALSCSNRSWVNA